VACWLCTLAICLPFNKFKYFSINKKTIKTDKNILKILMIATKLSSKDISSNLQRGSLHKVTI
jgi:hypothetical protein